MQAALEHVLHFIHIVASIERVCFYASVSPASRFAAMPLCLHRTTVDPMMPAPFMLGVAWQPPTNIDRS